MNSVKYPILVRALDDRSLRFVHNPSREELGWYERVDIDDGLYDGWDSAGAYFKLRWDEQSRLPSTEIVKPHDLDGLCLEAARYSEAMAHLKKKPRDSIAPEDVDRFVRAVEERSSGSSAGEV